MPTSRELARSPFAAEARLMAPVTYLEAIREAMVEEMARDERVFVIGEDIGAIGGAFRVTEGLLGNLAARVSWTRRFRRARSSARRSAPRTWVCGRSRELQFIDFITCCFDMITELRGDQPVPDRRRCADGRAWPVRRAACSGGPFHSANPEAFFLNTPGLKIVEPSTPYDAKGLLKAAIRDDDPVLFFEHKLLYRRLKEELPADDYIVPIGKAIVRRRATI